MGNTYHCGLQIVHQREAIASRGPELPLVSLGIPGLAQLPNGTVVIGGQSLRHQARLRQDLAIPTARSRENKGRVLPPGTPCICGSPQRSRGRRRQTRLPKWSRPDEQHPQIDHSGSTALDAIRRYGQVSEYLQIPKQQLAARARNTHGILLIGY
jgi:hypothetical protein